MASLSNINGIFDVHSTGAILFSTSHGTSGQILKSNGNAAPTWIPQSDIVGAYLPLAGGTLTGATATASGISFTVGGTLTGKSATFVRDASGYALRLDSANATTDNDLRFAKGGVDYAAIQVTGSTASDFQFYVNDGTNWINTLTFARADGQAVFTKLVSGIAPTADLNFATKKYVDDGRPDPGVTQITAGTNVTITPVGGTGNVTINANTQGDITALTLGNGLTGTSLTGPIPNVLMSGSYTGKFTIDSTGDVEYLALNTTATTNKRVRLQFTQNDNAGMEIGTDYSVDDSSNIYFYDRVAGSAMFFTSVASSYFPGSLRIGMTAASSQKLHVQGSNHFVTFENTSTTANHYSQMLLKAGTALGYIWTANQNSTNWGGPNSLNIYTGQAGAIAFFTTAVKRMTIQAAGNVYIETKLGIANSNPPAKLTVGPTVSSGATGISINVGAGEGNLIGIGNNNHNWFPFTNGQNYYSSDVHNFRNAAHSTTYMTLDSVGLGIGTTSPGYKLNVINDNTATWTARFTNNTNNVYLSVNDANNYGIYVSGETKNYFSGNIGIGTTSPQDKLNLHTSSASGNIGMKITRGTETHGLRLGVNNSHAFLWTTEAQNLVFATSGIQRISILSGGNVGIGTTSPTNYKLEVNGTVEGSAFSVDGASSRIFAPAGAIYNGSGTQTGYLIAKLPDNGASGINNMMTGVIRVFDYTHHESFDIHFAGYWYSGYNWTNCTAWIDSSSYDDRNFTVRFGAMTGAAGAGTRPYIIIGEGNSTWSYCKFSVINYEPGHSNNQAYKWDSGWNMDISATNPGVVARTVSNCQVNNWARNGQDLYYGSGTGNVGINTTAPSEKLHVEGRIRLGSTPVICSHDNIGIDIDQNNNSGSNYFRVTRDGEVTELFRVQENGHVGIGTTSPSQKLEVHSTIKIGETGVTGGKLISGDSMIFQIDSDNSSGTSSYRFRCNGTADDGSELMRIQENGRVGIGNTSPQTTLHTGPTTTITNVFTARFAASNFFASGGNSMFYVPDTAANIMMFGSNQFGTNQIEFYHKNPGTSQAYVGRISTSGSATSYVTSSDYRLKENIVPISDSISRLNQLKPSRFNFIEEPGKIVDGFIAHEVQDIVPEAIVGEKDEVDEDGGIIPQGIDQAKLVPLLVAAVQELEARVKELENK